MASIHSIISSAEKTYVIIDERRSSTYIGDIVISIADEKKKELVDLNLKGLDCDYVSIRRFLAKNFFEPSSDGFESASDDSDVALENIEQRLSRNPNALKSFEDSGEDLRVLIGDCLKLIYFSKYRGRLTSH